MEGFNLAAAAESVPDNIINFGTREEIAIRDLIRMIHAKTGSQSKLEIGELPYRPTEIWRMSAENERAQTWLQWKPCIPFEEGLERTFMWYRRYLEAYYNPESILHIL